jgi:molybdenum cofactor synthesis domain-containing protein
VAELRIGILTSSDTRARGEAEDTSGHALKQLCEERGWSVVSYDVCPDDRNALAAALMKMADEDSADVVLTTGGTGLGPRDVTPEATAQVAERAAPGIAEHIRAESGKITGRAMLSRGVSAVRGRTLIINLPGSERAARESFSFVVDQLEHAVEMMAGGGHG